MNRPLPPTPISLRFTRRSSLLPLLFSPGVLSVLLVHLDWVDVYTLLTTCKAFHNLINSLHLRDAILARFVTSYAALLPHRDLRVYQDVQITVRDLDLLLISQRVPLHRYPMHSLRILTTLYPSTEDDDLRAKLVALCQAHSRFVLLLQSLVHSSSAPMPVEPEEIKWKSRFSPVDNLRELTFPAPLSFAIPPSAPPLTEAGPSRLTKHARHRSVPNQHELTMNSTALHPLRATSSSRPSADTVSSMISRNNSVINKKARRLSIFRNRDTPLLSPPPPEEPRALKIYSSTWRRGTSQGEPAESAFPSSSRSLKQPRRFAATNGSSDSSVSGSPSPPHFSRSTNSFVGREYPAPIRMASPHDLNMATSRIRAPILRVFVPCSKLEHESESVPLCERQLVESGLWDHLSTGDIICNLGYVPPTDDSSSDDNYILQDPSFHRRGSYLPNSNHAPSNSNAQRKWLIFNGHFLIPYTPPDVLPLYEPLNLPTPFYYAHIMPPLTNMTFTITRLPVCDDVPQLTLIHSSTKVRSPHSPRGYAIVKKHAWTARVVRMRTDRKSVV